MRSYSKLLVLFFILLSCTARAQSPGGIGAVLMADTAEGGTIMPRIKSVVPNSPAAALPLPLGYYIVAVGDFACKNKSLEEVVNHIRGEAGTAVTLSLADNPQGKKPKNYTITRAVMQQPKPELPMVAPVTIFNSSCDNVAKALKKQGFSIIKSFNSDCGNFYFNFDGDNSTYHARVLIMEAKAGAKEVEATAYLFNNADENNKTPLKPIAATEQGNYTIAGLDGTIALTRGSIGVVSVQIAPPVDAAKCMAMYVVVYK